MLDFGGFFWSMLITERVLCTVSPLGYILHAHEFFDINVDYTMFLKQDSKPYLFKRGKIKLNIVSH